MKRSEEHTREQIAQALKGLTKEEQHLLSQVLAVEREKIHVGRPHLTDDLRKAVIGAIKA